MSDMNRGTGRTTAMIRALPDAGAIIVTPHSNVRRQILRLLLELRGPEFDKRCNVVVIESQGDFHRIAGSARAVALDHTFDVMTPRALAEEVKAYARAVNQVYWPLAA